MKNNFKAAACSLSPVSTMHDMPPAASVAACAAGVGRARVCKGGRKEGVAMMALNPRSTSVPLVKGRKRGKREERRTQRHTGRDASRGAGQV